MTSSWYWGLFFGSFGGGAVLIGTAVIAALIP